MASIDINTHLAAITDAEEIFRDRMVSYAKEDDYAPGIPRTFSYGGRARLKRASLDFTNTVRELRLGTATMAQFNAALYGLGLTARGAFAPFRGPISISNAKALDIGTILADCVRAAKAA